MEFYEYRFVSGSHPVTMRDVAQAANVSVSTVSKALRNDPTIPEGRCRSIQEMAKRGCHGYASFYLNAAQGSSELEQTTRAAKETFTIIAESIAANNVASKLECSLQKDAFRRLVR